MVKKTCAMMLLFAGLLVLASCGSGPVRDRAGGVDENRGRAEGWARIFDEDTALARDRAIDDARRKLIEKLLGTTISGRKVVENFRLVSSIVEAKMFGLVRDERIVKEWQEGSLFKVIIEGTVEPSAVDDVVRKVLKDYGRPRFLLLIEESIEGAASSPGFTETEMLIQNIMGEAGFSFIDNTTVQKLMKDEGARMKRALQGDVARDVQDLLLDRYGAEVVIVGTAVVADQSAVLEEYNVQNMKSKSAIIKLKAVDVYTGAILASDSRQAPGLHINGQTASKYAIENALRLIVGKKKDDGSLESGPFINTIARNFVEATSHRQISMSVAGLDYRDMTAFRNALSQRIRGVQEVLARGQSGKFARIDVYFAGKATDFIDELVAKSEKIGFSVEILESYPSRVTMKARRLQ
jgi:hypothetical protein